MIRFAHSTGSTIAIIPSDVIAVIGVGKDASGNHQVEIVCRNASFKVYEDFDRAVRLVEEWNSQNK